MLSTSRPIAELARAKQKSAESGLQKLQQSTKSEQSAFEAALQQAQNKSSAVSPDTLAVLEEQERSASFGSDLDWFVHKDNQLVVVESAVPVIVDSNYADETTVLLSGFKNNFYDEFTSNSELIDWLDESAEQEREGQWDFELLDSHSQTLSLHIARHQDGQWSASVSGVQSDIAQNTLDVVLAQKGVFVIWEDSNE